MRTQNERVLMWLESGSTITQDDCDRMIPKIQRLAARIMDLKLKGHRIASKAITTPGGARVAEYSLIADDGSQTRLFADPGRGRPV